MMMKMPAKIPATEKKREIFFSELHPDQNQAETARQMLGNIQGVLSLQVIHSLQLNIHYDLRFLCLADIEDTLTEVGFHLDNSLMLRLKRALYHYTETTECANIGCIRCQDKNTRDIFIDRYQKQTHGCRDQRPSHWRDYL
ncbi:hypothetical protein MNBD_GAMMA25-5 [hydrothermal vent metagenome]|uniref:Uncharacterized protein n=1 Tax=hydrothermal vent metagenome TaxID=652676 RepID=A0A3B1AXW9_9ZZZZ